VSFLYYSQNNIVRVDKALSRWENHRNGTAINFGLSGFESCGGGLATLNAVSVRWHYRHFLSEVENVAQRSLDLWRTGY
jgi:hypothetical protein